MQSSRELDTKTKIITSAFELFGRYGFEGTSIRAISKQSGANLSAINYHFKNKDNLFWEIMVRSYQEVDQATRDFASSSKDTTELALKTFDYFNQQKIMVKNVMKMLLAEGMKPSADPAVRQVLDNPMGPPGGQYFAEMIQKDIPYPLNREGQLWGVKSIFGTVFHWGVMLCAEHVCDDEDPLMQPDQIRKDVKGMVLALMLFLKAHPECFKKI